ncbi:thiamine-phosphate pyrophosphorylase [Rubidibacter lacunae KORDI 51-2]|uniref:Thiamine-phosphate synthase n=1 Tax=Rubidibacter lacunae KORDI 51-2 TaxID=582515 RepID=U5DMK0_9CHRO|nr:thiamine phosphate synthase [Rubidibacter lacunae]ERN40930.1 thiamine-phosphate pyrophosphorylase [Rubidibacter lacunae KORDI 51-2]
MSGAPPSDSFARSPELAVRRILDANLDRAREGLRVVEDWCRFGLDDRELAGECKDLRQELARWHAPEWRAARDTPGDRGTELTHVGETQRADIAQLLQANLCRVEEALRVLEEFGKLNAPDLGAACKQLRYRAYALDSRLLPYRRHQQLRAATLYLITTPTDDLATSVEAALQSGVTLVQYRDKDSTDRSRLEQARQLRDLCHRHNALFIINDRVDLALSVDADGVHLGQQDLPIAVARRLLGPQRLIGCSTTNPEELARALAEGADYLGVGPVFATPTKPGKAPAGFDYVRHAAARCSRPWFAIGGIDASNVGEVVRAGARQVAVVRAIVAADRPADATRALLSQLPPVTPSKLI